MKNEIDNIYKQAYRDAAEKFKRLKELEHSDLKKRIRQLEEENERLRSVGKREL
jgi:hypothetical protein